MISMISHSTNVLRTHPTIVYEHGVIDNPHYRNPGKILAGC